MQKLIVITGPTATGKSDLTVELAKKFQGEIISADSRQVYRGLDIGSAKITADEMGGIPHYLIDVADPQDIFTVAEFQDQAKQALQTIFARNHIPIIAGGTGMYISTLINNTQLPQVPPNEKIRTELEKLSTVELFHQLQKSDSVRATTIDPNNRHRLIRALEIFDALGKVPETTAHTPEYKILIIGLTLPKEELTARIAARITARIPALFDEIKKLLSQGVSADRLRSFGLEYKYGLEFVEGKINLQEFKTILATKTWQFVRRQMTWWKRDPRVVWMNPILDHKKILKQVQDFLTK